jgi:ASCH domain
VPTLNLFGWKDAGLFDFGRRAKHDSGSAVAGETEEVGPRGLMVRDPFASQILDGEKVWEIRGRPTQIRGPIVIVKSGTGRAFGTVNLVRVLGPLELVDLENAPELPLSERDEISQRGLPYPKTYAYVLSNARGFRQPISYRHPSGAVTWVRLPDLDLEAVRYAASPFGGSQPRLV